MLCRVDEIDCGIIVGFSSRFTFVQVLTLQCEECGKPCKSETEKDIHTKRTGHQTFVDKVFLMLKTICISIFVDTLLSLLPCRCSRLSQWWWSVESPYCPCGCQFRQKKTSIRDTHCILAHQWNLKNLFLCCSMLKYTSRLVLSQ